MGCSTPIKVTVQAPAYIPPTQVQQPTQGQCQTGTVWDGTKCVPVYPLPATPGQPYIAIQYLLPGQPAAGMMGKIYSRVVSGATSYNALFFVNGKQVESQAVSQALIQYQNSNGIAPQGAWLIQTPPFNIGDTVQVQVQACNSGGCSSSPVLTINNVQPGNYGTPV